MAAMNVDVQQMMDSMRSRPAPILTTSQTAAILAPLAGSAAQVTAHSQSPLLAPVALQTQAVSFPLSAEIEQLANNEEFCAGVAEQQSKPQVFRS